MRRDTRSTVRSIGAGVPAALLGSIALTALAPPAHATPPDGSQAVVNSPSARLTGTADAPVDTVQPGDTVTAVAARHGLQTEDVLGWNGLTWSSIIQPGQQLRLSAPEAATPVPDAPEPAPPTSSVYGVVAGDTISDIARRHGVSTDALLAANGLVGSSIIYPGQAVTVPGASGSAATPVAPPPEPAEPAPPAPQDPPAPPVGLYTVVDGDTVSAIAATHGVSTDELLAANSLSRASIIYPGETVTIPTTAPAASAIVPAAATAAVLDPEQNANVQVIVRVGRELGVPDRGIAIALATAMQESSLRNLDDGPDDSAGLFQQRPSTGWGSDAEVRDPDLSARAFFGGHADPSGTRTAGLLDIGGWESMGFAQAAQAVQISAYPDAYAVWEQSAYVWLATAG